MLCLLSYTGTEEAVGFEPTVPIGTPAFKTGAINHSATPPWNLSDYVGEMVGETGFEPATLGSQNRCATRLRYSPMTERLKCAP